MSSANATPTGSNVSMTRTCPSTPPPTEPDRAKGEDLYLLSKLMMELPIKPPKCLMMDFEDFPEMDSEEDE